jgi:hypothetical protein
VSEIPSMGSKWSSSMACYEYMYDITTETTENVQQARQARW